MNIIVPELCLIALVGPSGSGKFTGRDKEFCLNGMRGKAPAVHDGLQVGHIEAVQFAKEWDHELGVVVLAQGSVGDRDDIGPDPRRYVSLHEGRPPGPALTLVFLPVFPRSAEPG